MIYDAIRLICLLLSSLYNGQWYYLEKKDTIYTLCVFYRFINQLRVLLDGTIQFEVTV